MAILFRLHRETWGQAALFARGRERVLHEKFSAAAHGSGWLRLWILELNDRPAAALYGFRFAGDEYFYQSGRDPVYARDSVGQVLLAHAVQSALEDGVREYRLLRGDETYKSRYANADVTVQTIAVANSRRGSAAVRAARLRRRPIPPAREQSS
jgi:CelD/BcsL family acetyltransferase involved in cellulose biosynthesis